MKKFVPENSNDEIKAIGVILSVLFLGLTILGIANFNEGGMLLIGLCLIVGVPTLILTKNINKVGFYIDGDKLSFKRLKSKEYSIDDIQGIMVLPHQVQGSRRGFGCLFRIKTKENTIIYLSEVLPEFYTFEKGDLDFEDLYRKHILFRTVYDEDVIKYLKERNIPIISKI